MADRAVPVASAKEDPGQLHRVWPADRARGQAVVVDCVARSADSADQVEEHSAELDVAQPRRVLGMPVTVVTNTALLESITHAVETRMPTVFVGLYAALFRATAEDFAYRDLLERSVTYPDGQGLVIELHRRGVAEAERLATTDMVYPIVELAARHNWRVGLYGAAPGVAERAARKLVAAAPGVDVVAVWDGFSSSPTVEELRLARLDVLFVALGARRQESWAHSVATVAGVPAVLTCGGLLDFVAGDKRRAPLWVQRVGLEWAFRVLLEPRRLLSRYVLGNTYFLWHVRRDRFQSMSGSM